MRSVGVKGPQSSALRSSFQHAWLALFFFFFEPASERDIFSDVGTSVLNPRRGMLCDINRVLGNSTTAASESAPPRMPLDPSCLTIPGHWMQHV